MSHVPRDHASTATDLHIEATYRLTEALVEAENRMRRRVELLSEVVFETDAGGRLVFLNSAWTTVVGYTAAVCLGQSLSTFVVDEDWPACHRMLVGAADAEPAARPLIRLHRPDGAIRWMELSVSQIAGGGAVGAFHDVTKQKVAQDELAKLSLVASYTDNLVIITDRDGCTEWVNQAFTNRTGYTLADLAGRKPGELLQGPASDPEMVHRIREWLREGRSFKAELVNYTKAGEPYWVQFHITPIRGEQGDVDRFVSIQTDSTELHRTQLELEAAKERAESASEAKTQFLATISHEMRTPLNAILGSIDLASQEAGGRPELDTHLARIADGAEALLRLISDLLDISKIEAGQIDIEDVPVELRTCLDAAVSQVAGRAHAKGLDFALACDPSLPVYLQCDPDRLRQIVINLAENAVKFTDRGHVRVDVSAVDHATDDGAALQIRVVDSGVGISDEAQTRVFDRFVQGDSSTTRRKGGAGLGLNIVKSLVEAMGGSVTVRSRQDEGSDFRVLLPLTPAVAPASRPSMQVNGTHTHTVVAAGHPARILVAEDTDANFAVLDTYLRRAGYLVERAVNGLEAAAAAPRCDLVLMDLEMPEMDGLEATRRIRAAERARCVPPVPVLALTAHALQEYRGRCLAAGCTGYLTKPVRMHTLLDAVGSALEHAAAAGGAEYQEADALVVTVRPILAHLVPDFLDYCELEQVRLRDAVAAGNWADAARMGHTLKGTGPSMGFDEVGRLGLEIEQGAKAADGERVRRSIERLASHLRRVTVVGA